MLLFMKISSCFAIDFVHSPPNLSRKMILFSNFVSSSSPVFHKLELVIELYLFQRTSHAKYIPFPLQFL